MCVCVFAYLSVCLIIDTIVMCHGGNHVTVNDANACEGKDLKP